MPNKYKQDAENQRKKIEEIVGIKVMEDSGWVLTWSSPRGIYDYTRKIKFASAMLPTKFDELRTFLKNNECPGWTGVRGDIMTVDDKDICTVYTTWDSTD